MSYLNCMKANFRIPSSYTVCFSHFVAIGYFKVAWIYVNRWTIVSNSLWIIYFTCGASKACKNFALPIIPKSLNFKQKSVEITNIWRSLVSPCFFVIFLFCSGPRSDKFLINMDTVLKSVVYHLLPADRDCIKVRIGFWTSEYCWLTF